MTGEIPDQFSVALAAAEESVGARAAALDEGSTDVLPDLSRLGQSGLFDAALDDDSLSDVIRVIDKLAAQSLAVGLSTWAHTTVMRYLRMAPRDLRDEYIGALRAGSRPGATAMASGLKQLAGLGDMATIAESRSDGISVTGRIPWASNLFQDALIVLPARSVSGSTFVVVVDADAPGVTINPAPPLMALGATASTSIDLKSVNVAAGHILSTDLSGFLTQVRPSLLLLQTALCLGVGRAAVEGACGLTGPLIEQFTDDLRAVANKITELGELLYTFGTQPQRRPIEDLIRLRLDTATTAVSATRLEIAVAGGAAYARNSAANRRFREAAVLPIQSPSEGQLRRELQRYESSVHRPDDRHVGLARS